MGLRCACHLARSHTFDELRLSLEPSLTRAYYISVVDKRDATLRKKLMLYKTPRRALEIETQNVLVVGKVLPFYCSDLRKIAFIPDDLKFLSVGPSSECCNAEIYLSRIRTLTERPPKSLFIEESWEAPR